MFKRFFISALAFFPMILSASEITRITDNSFNLHEIGFYHVKFETTLAGPGQLQLRLNGIPMESSTVGTLGESNQIIGLIIIETKLENTVLEVINPEHSAPIQIVGSAHLSIVRVK
jgi:hypothetical protein